MPKERRTYYGDSENSGPAGSFGGKPGKRAGFPVQLKFSRFFSNFIPKYLTKTDNWSID
jgi:hypothetical protein